MAAFLGIIGEWDGQEARENAAKLMTHALGMPAFGPWAAPDAPFSLYCRLNEPLDLTPDGRQPALCPDPKLVVAFDGYIGNGAALRREVEEGGRTLRGHGDAELLCEASALWGLNRLLQKLEGSFVFALWDGTTKSLHLVRDRLGTRPLFLHKTDKGLAFATDIRAIKALPGFKPTPDKQALSACLVHGYIPAPLTIDANITVLEAGHRLMVQDGEKPNPKSEKWWSPAATLEEIALRQNGLGNSSNRIDKLRNTLVQEAARMDVAFSVLDDGSNESRLLQNAIAQSVDKPHKPLKCSVPDGVTLQTAFDALAHAPLPCTDPAALLWWLALHETADQAPVTLLATESAFLEKADPQTMPKRWQKFAGRLMPKQFPAWYSDPYAAYRERNMHWPELADADGFEKFETPRMDLSDTQHLAYLEMCGPFMGGTLSQLSALASMEGLDIRLPMADHRVLEFCLPRAGASVTDIPTWLRGPLRIRMQNALTPKMYTALGIENPEPFESAWAKFLAGDNTHARKLWVYLTTAVWTNLNTSATISA